MDPSHSRKDHRLDISQKMIQTVLMTGGDSYPNVQPGYVQQFVEKPHLCHPPQDTQVKSEAGPLPRMGLKVLIDQSMVCRM